MGVLHSLQNKDEYVATLNGIPMKMYEQAHFTVEEWNALAPTGYKKCSFMFTIPFHECIQTDVISFLGRGKEYRELVMQNYLLSLAFTKMSIAFRIHYEFLDLASIPFGGCA